MKSPRELADYLTDFTILQLEEIEQRYFHEFNLPSLFAGYPMGSDVQGDLVFVLGLLHDLGHTHIAGKPVTEILSAVLKQVNGAETHSFYSYRIAETLDRFGPFEGNPLLTDFTPAERENVAAACDSTGLISELEESLPKNYVAVLARCEIARKQLGIPISDPQLDTLLAGTKSLMSANSLGFIDDSNTGDGRYDIYSADIYLFTEPFAEKLGSTWPNGFANVLNLVEHTLTSDGTAIPWGRSTGALGLCITIELCAMALGRRLTSNSSAWLKYGLDAAAKLDDWFLEGLVSAHQYRSTFAYRGPHRRVQMTLDMLGKLLQSATELVKVRESIVPGDSDAYFHHDQLLPLSSTGNASVWSYRSKDARFVLPLVGSPGSDYLPVPRNPGLLEYPVDSDLATGVPVVTVDGNRYIPAMLPDEVLKADAVLQVRWHGMMPLTRRFEGTGQKLEGEVETTYRVEGARITMDQVLSFGKLPTGITLQVTELKSRPLKVEFSADHPSHCSSVQVLGSKEYRSFWNELAQVHQIDVRPGQTGAGGQVNLRVSITPKLRICNTIGDHHYQRSLYDPIQADVFDRMFPPRCWRNLKAATEFLRDIDQFHLHWPEHFLGTDVNAHLQMIDCIHQSGVRIIWTQHNLVPHAPEHRDNAQEIYQAWAAAADAVVHHSESGKRRVHNQYHFNPAAIERTIFHGHFGNLMNGTGGRSRAEVEAELGLRPCKLRIGIVGAPRIEKNTQGFIDAFARSSRDDLQLLVTSLRGDEIIPDDPRITALTYDMVDRDIYNDRLKTIDVLAFPIDEGDLLTTGVVGDAIGWGIPGLITSWDFLSESLQDAGIPMGDSIEEMTATINSLQVEQVRKGARAAQSMQDSYDWKNLSRQFLLMLRELGTAKL